LAFKGLKEENGNKENKHLAILLSTDKITTLKLPFRSQTTT